MADTSLSLLWPDDRLPESSGVAALADGPDTDLAIILLASGCTQAFVRSRCRFESSAAVARFCRDPETVTAVAEHAAQRARTIGNRAMVRLERILSEEHTDLRATVLAVRTGLEVGGVLRRDPAPPLKTVRELSVAELSALIEATKREISARRDAAGIDPRPSTIESIA